VTKKINGADEDANLFKTAVGPVRRIETNTVLLQPDKKPRPIPAIKPLDPVYPLQQVLDDPVATLYQEDKVAFISPGLQKGVLKKLRKGYYGMDANIDLHGLNSRQALQELLAFLHHCVQAGSRCVLIVHGKGYHTPDNQPVLKNDINLWLRQHKDVLAFCSSPARAGGAGALFVLLRLSGKYADDDESL
jgi:DNA-nicking Smr family endonuclease